GINPVRRTILLILLLVGLGVRVQAQDDSPPWWRDRVFYEVFVRSFYDSDADGTGDLQGLIQKLDYLNDGDPATTDDLGVTGLWLMPIMPAASYHGYDVTDYRGIAPDYGTRADFAALIDAAHARGMAVIVDLVLNHTSNRHPWFLSSSLGPDSPYADYYIWRDEDPGYRGPWQQTVWHRLNGRYYYAVFLNAMPDLNYANPAVTQEMDDVARFWLEDMGVDGFRLDAVRHLIENGPEQVNTPDTLSWFKSFHSFVRAAKPEALLVGEIWSVGRQMTQYVPRAVDMAFEFDLASALIDAVKRRSKDGLIAVQQQAFDLFPPGQYAAFLTNHDQNRVMSEFRGDVGAAKVAATLLLTNPGVPFLYYGEEIGMQGQKPDERIRTPKQWTDDLQNAGFSSVPAWEPPDASAAAFNVAAQTEDPDSLLSHYRRLIHLRGESAALQVGEFIPVETSVRPVYSFLRHTPEETVLVLINLNHKEIGDYSLSLPAGPLTGAVAAEWLLGEGDLHAPQINAAGGFADYQPLDVLPPRSSFVIRLR
ncbi:MAG: alpha-amylase, partial [Anaerolineae bacterium]|nr:alpha-amylase [Anaerolineae bacterium]